jgi:hypothetical protein
MTRKERGEDVYGCMLGQTLNDESSQRSNPINCTLKKEKKKEDGILCVKKQKLTSEDRTAIVNRVLFDMIWAKTTLIGVSSTQSNRIRRKNQAST